MAANQCYKNKNISIIHILLYYKWLLLLSTSESWGIHLYSLLIAEFKKQMSNIKYSI